MSIFQYEISGTDLSEMAKIAEHELINSFIRLDKDLRPVIEGLCNKGTAKIDGPTIPQRRKTLAWLSQNPLILRDSKAAIASPIFYSYHETADHITINGEITGFLEQLGKVISKYEMPPIHIKRKRSAGLLADLAISKKQRKSYAVEDLRSVLEVPEAEFASYPDIIGALEPIQREIAGTGGSFKYYPDDDEQVTKITIDVIYPKGS